MTNKVSGNLPISAVYLVSSILEHIFLSLLFTTKSRRPIELFSQYHFVYFNMILHSENNWRILTFKAILEDI